MEYEIDRPDTRHRLKSIKRGTVVRTARAICVLRNFPVVSRFASSSSVQFSRRVFVDVELALVRVSLSVEGKRENKGGNRIGS